MSHRVTIICDNCETNHMIEEEMDLPPYWIGVRMVIADKDGLVPPHERDDTLDVHFCSEECAAEYLMGSDFKSRRSMVDRQFTEEPNDPSDE
jgi:hypothetical protein